MKIMRKKSYKTSKNQGQLNTRFFIVNIIFLLVAGLLIGRAVQLQVFEHDFLQGEGDSRYLRTVSVDAYRGTINDRNGETLAMSAPVMSIWVNPSKLEMSRMQLKKLSGYLGMPLSKLKKKLKGNVQQHFLYLKRQVPLAVADKIMSLGVNGLFKEKEYKRYYPAVDVAANVVGFTNVDGKGIDGIEMLYNEWLRGSSGKKRILKGGGQGGIIENVEYLSSPKSGQDITLSLDMRLQHLAYEGIKRAVKKNKAKSASAVILSAKTGEILAMTNYPAYNPNQRSGKIDERYRNRVVTDEIEPGSTAKPFAILAALDNGLITPQTMVSTAPGYYRVGRKTIRDHRNYGQLDIAGILRHSSNVGASKIALMMNYSQIYENYRRMGFGTDTGSSFPGEVLGRLNRIENPHPIEQATLSYGYGLTTTTLQLARAYLVIANAGRIFPVTLNKLDGFPASEQVVKASAANTVLHMLEGVVKKGAGGTGGLARVSGYRVAGKTGTIHKNKRGQYIEDQYIALFSGIIPVSDPELVMVVMVDRPSAGDYYGGLVAAPVFSYVMERSMRLLNIRPDDLGRDSQEILYRDRPHHLKIANL